MLELVDTMMLTLEVNEKASTSDRIVEILVAKSVLVSYERIISAAYIVT